MGQFRECFWQEIRGARLVPRTLAQGECRSPEGSPCGLCHAMTLTYESEYPLRKAAFEKFWHSLFPSYPPLPLIPSPRGREYRTVTKRKAFRVPGGLRLGLIGPTGTVPGGGIPVARCALEPAEHARLYAHHEQALNAPWCSALREVISYVVLKGGHRATGVIWNVRRLTPAVIRSSNRLSKSLTETFGSALSGVYLYTGDDSGRYYLGSRNPSAHQDIRKLYGKPDLSTRADGRVFRYPPLAFSQINESLLDRFVREAGDLLSPEKGDLLLDLYCGYGLFALSLANRVRLVTGVELSRSAVAAAKENAARMGVSNSRFIAGEIRADRLPGLLPTRPFSSRVILDPPRRGTSEGVIEAIAARRPTRVLHVFCNPDVLPTELQRWFACGYDILRVVPFDLFPGTDEIETMVLLAPRGQ